MIKLLNKVVITVTVSKTLNDGQVNLAVGGDGVE